MQRAVGVAMLVLVSGMLVRMFAGVGVRMRMHAAVRMRVRMFMLVFRDGNAFDPGVAVAAAASRAHGVLLARNSGDQVIAISLSLMSPPSTTCSW